MVAAHFDIPNKKRQEILETLDVTQRLAKVYEILVRELELAALGQKIHDQIRERIEASQKEFFLREQLRAIRKELGEEKDEIAMAVQNYKERFVGFDELIGNVFDFGDESVALEKRQNAHTTDAVDEHRIRSIGHASHAHDMPDTAHFRQIIGLELHRVVVFVFDFAPQEAQIIAMRLGALDELEHRAWRHDNWHHHIGIYDRLG